MDYVEPALRELYVTGNEVLRPLPPEEVRMIGKYFRERPRQWAKLVARGIRVRLIGLRQRVRSVCGSFFREKSGDQLRWVFDGRRTNAQLVPPPDMTSTTPAALARLECSPTNPLFIVKSDIVAFFFTQVAPGWLVEWLGLPSVPLIFLLDEGIGWEELAALTGMCERELRTLTDLHPVFLAWPMGLSHSQAVTQGCHRGLLRRHAGLEDDQYLHDRAAVPRTDTVFSVICDDLFALCRSRPSALALDRRLAAAYARAGLQRHPDKTVAGVDAEDLAGVRFNGRGSLGPKPATLHRLYRGSLEVLCRRLISPRTLSRVVGSWTWLLMTWRPGLVVLQESYGFVHNMQRKPAFLKWPVQN